MFTDKINPRVLLLEGKQTNKLVKTLILIQDMFDVELILLS